MERQYVAIDLHLQRSLVVRENEAGEKVGAVRIDNDPLALAAALREAGEEPEVAIEATYGWYWAVDLLQEEGAKVHLVNPSGLNWEDRRVKNDYRDCCDLLDRMRLGKLPEAWIAPPAVRELRELVRYRAKLVALRTGLKAQLKAVLAKHGLRPPVKDLWGVAGPAWLDELQLPRGYEVRVESPPRPGGRLRPGGGHVGAGDPRVVARRRRLLGHPGHPRRRAHHRRHDGGRDRRRVLFRQP